MPRPDERQDRPAPRPLDGVLVVALEQAVAAPYCSSRLADAGARVIKIERPEGDFARGYDSAVFGESSYWVWINRGKESIALDLKNAADLAVLERMLAKADVFIQNLAPGATERLGIGSAALREGFPRLVTCDINGYGDDGPMVKAKAYDLLVQAESGLVAISGAPGQGVESLGRIGVSLCDINAGLNALVGIQQALVQRGRTGRGSGVQVSLFGSAAELMSVPYLQTRYGGQAPKRVGLKHPTIAPYGAFTCADGRDILVSIQNEREWSDFCRLVLRRPELPEDPRCARSSRRSRCGPEGVAREWSARRSRPDQARQRIAQPLPRHDAQRPCRRVDMRDHAVVPGVLSVADACAGVRDGARGHATAFQHGQRGDACIVLADAGIVEERRPQRHL